MNFKELRESGFLSEQLPSPDKAVNHQLLSDLARAQEFLTKSRSPEITGKFQSARESMAAFNALITQAEANNDAYIIQRINTVVYLGGTVIIMSLGLYGLSTFLEHYNRLVYSENQDDKLLVNFFGYLGVIGFGLYGFAVEGLTFLEQLKPVYKVTLAAIKPHMIEVLSYYYQQTDAANSPERIGQLQIDISRLDLTKFIGAAIKNHSLKQKI